MKRNLAFALRVLIGTEPAKNEVCNKKKINTGFDISQLRQKKMKRSPWLHFSFSWAPALLLSVRLGRVVLPAVLPAATSAHWPVGLRVVVLIRRILASVAMVNVVPHTVRGARTRRHGDSRGRVIKPRCAGKERPCALAGLHVIVRELLRLGLLLILVLLMEVARLDIVMLRVYHGVSKVVCGSVRPAVVRLPIHERIRVILVRGGAEVVGAILHVHPVAGADALLLLLLLLYVVVIPVVAPRCLVFVAVLLARRGGVGRFAHRRLVRVCADPP